MKKFLMLTVSVICLLAVLTACSQKGTEAASDKTDDETQTISGTVNHVDDYLVLLDDDGEYRLFDFGEDVDSASLEEGDGVTVTYTGALDSEDPLPVAVAIEKAD